MIYVSLCSLPVVVYASSIDASQFAVCFGLVLLMIDVTCKDFDQTEPRCIEHSLAQLSQLS